MSLKGERRAPKSGRSRQRHPATPVQRALRRLTRTRPLRLQALREADSPKKLCKWFAEGKGCRRGKECRFLHDWGQIPKAEKADRCMLCGGKGHRKDACTVVANGAMAKRDDGASSAKAARSDASPKAKMGDPGLRKVISEAATVLREAMSTSATAGESKFSSAHHGCQCSGR